MGSLRRGNDGQKAVNVADGVGKGGLHVAHKETRLVAINPATVAKAVFGVELGMRAEADDKFSLLEQIFVLEILLLLVFNYK